MILMGNHDETKNIMMKKSRVKFPWMQTKYGDNSDPWDYTVKFPNIEGGVDGALKHDASFSNFIYFYGWQDYKTNQVVFERFPQRALHVQDASQYKGSHGSQTKQNYWHNTDKVFIVNG